MIRSADLISFLCLINDLFLFLLRSSNYITGNFLCIDHNVFFFFCILQCVAFSRHFNGLNSFGIFCLNCSCAAKCTMRTRSAWVGCRGTRDYSRRDRIWRALPACTCITGFSTASGYSTPRRLPCSRVCRIRPSRVALWDGRRRRLAIRPAAGCRRSLLAIPGLRGRHCGWIRPTQRWVRWAVIPVDEHGFAHSILERERITRYSLCSYTRRCSGCRSRVRSGAGGALHQARIPRADGMGALETRHHVLRPGVAQLQVLLTVSRTVRFVDSPSTIRMLMGSCMVSWSVAVL